MSYKVILSWLIFLFASGCNTYTPEYNNIDKDLWYFANDIIEHPENLKVLKEKYPNFIDDRFLNDSLRSQNFIDSLIHYINYDFKLRKGKKIVSNAGFTSQSVRNYNTQLKKYRIFSKDELYGFCIEKRGEGIKFVFIKSNEKYFLFIAYNYVFIY